VVLRQPAVQHASPGEQTAPLHVHDPPKHVSDGSHILPQRPQLPLSDDTSTHAPVQQTFGAGHGMPLQSQVPVVEQVPSGQQSGGVPVQAAPVPHLHVPPVQVSPGLHG